MNPVEGRVLEIYICHLLQIRGEGGGGGGYNINNINIKMVFINYIQYIYRPIHIHMLTFHRHLPIHKVYNCMYT